MFKYVLLVLISVFGGLVMISRVVGVPEVVTEVGTLTLSRPHYFEDETQSIESIHIQAVYFIPENKKDSYDSDWKTPLRLHLERLIQFHTLQLGSTSQLTYTIDPEPIIGRYTNEVYDTDVTQHGNPEALKSIFAELAERNVINPSYDDMYDYAITFILYEGVGAVASEDAFLVSNRFSADPSLNTVGASVIAHEFYHTLGLPDAYTIPEANPTSTDLMGYGRFQPLEYTYLDRGHIGGLGL